MTNREELLAAALAALVDRSVMEEAAMIAGTCPATVFYAADGTQALVLFDQNPYVVHVSSHPDLPQFNNGDPTTQSAHLVTVAPAEVAAALNADEDEIGGWSTGWEC